MGGREVSQVDFTWEKRFGHLQLAHYTQTTPMGNKEESQGAFTLAKGSRHLQLAQGMMVGTEKGMGFGEEKSMPFDYTLESEGSDYSPQMVYKEVEVDPKLLCALSLLFAMGGSPSDWVT